MQRLHCQNFPVAQDNGLQKDHGGCRLGINAGRVTGRQFLKKLFGNEGSMKNKQKRFQIRQGDVLVQSVDQIPADSIQVERDNGRIVLAYGEVTGHAHAISSNAAEMLRAENGDRYLHVTQMAQLVHEEHTAHDIPPGMYQVIQQREYSPEEIRNVAD